MKQDIGEVKSKGRFSPKKPVESKTSQNQGAVIPPRVGAIDPLAVKEIQKKQLGDLGEMVYFVVMSD